MASKYWERKPVGDTILGKVARDYALRRAGIDPRSPSEIQRDNEDRQRAIRNFDKYDREHNEVVETSPAPSDSNE